MVATTTQIGDFVREVGGDDVDVHQILAPEHRPPRLRAAAGRRHQRGRREARVRPTATTSTPGSTRSSTDSGSDAKVVDLGATVPVKLPGESGGPGGLPVRPALVARPAERRGGGPADRGAALGDRSGGQADLRGQRRRLRGEAESARQPGSDTASSRFPVADRKLVTDHDAFDYFANRYGIQVVGAVIPSQTTQAQPNAAGPQQPGGPDPAARTSRRSFPRARSAPSSPRRSPRRPGRPPTTRSTATRSGPAGSSGRHLPEDGGGERRRDGRRASRGAGSAESVVRCSESQRWQLMVLAATDDWPPATAAAGDRGRHLRGRARAARRAARAERRRQDDPAARPARRAAADARDGRGRRPGRVRSRRPSARASTSRSRRSTSP